MKKCIAILFLLAAPPVTADTTALALSDCGEWIQKPADHRKSWLLGYLSGQNRMWRLMQKAKPAADPLSEITSAQQAYLWMDKYCRENPLSDVADGADVLFLQLVLKK